MDRTAYFIRTLHQAEADELLDISCQRMLGEAGPGVAYNESWGQLLVQADHQGTPEFRTRLREILVQQLHILPSQFAAMATDTSGAWLQFVTALHTAADINWEPSDALTNLRGLLYSWLNNLPQPLPAPRERTPQGTGYPQTDLIATLYRLVAERLPWEPSLAESLWGCSQIAQPPVTPAQQQIVRAERLWWLAQWAIRRDPTDQSWLAQHIDRLSQALEAAEWWPGDLTRLFISVETRIADGQRRIALLIQQVPYPETRERRQKLAAQLHYFAEDNRALRETTLQTMYNDTSRDTPKPPEMIIVPDKVFHPRTTADEARLAMTHLETIAVDPSTINPHTLIDRMSAYPAWGAQL